VGASEKCPVECLADGWASGENAHVVFMLHAVLQLTICHVVCNDKN